MEVRGSDDVYFKSAATDRSISVGRGYGNNDPVGYTNDKEIKKEQIKMRLYLEHRKQYLLYREALKKVEDILNEYEIISAKVHPKSALAEHEREFSKETILPASGKKINKTEEYVIALEQRRIEERLYSAKLILQERTELLKLKEEEIRKSKDIYNMVYTAKWIDGLKNDAIVKQTGYSRSQVYNIVGHLMKQLEREN